MSKNLRMLSDKKMELHTDIPRYYFMIFYILSILSSIIILATIALILSTDQAKAFDIYHFFLSASYFAIQVVIALHIKKVKGSFQNNVMRDFEDDTLCFFYGYINEVLGFFLFYMTFLLSNERYNHTFEHYRYHRMERQGAIFGRIGLSFILSISITLGPFVADRYTDPKTGLCYSNWMCSRPYGIIMFFMFLCPFIYHHFVTSILIVYWRVRTRWYHPHIPLIRYKKQWYASVANLKDPLNTFFLVITIQLSLLCSATLIEIVDHFFGNTHKMHEMFLYCKIFSSIPHSITILYYDKRYMLFFRPEIP